jgi:hypothetical protein
LGKITQKLVSSYMKKLRRCESLFEIIKTKRSPTLVWVLYFHIALLPKLHITYKTLGEKILSAFGGHVISINIISRKEEGYHGYSLRMGEILHLIS